MDTFIALSKTAATTLPVSFMSKMTRAPVSDIDSNINDTVYAVNFFAPGVMYHVFLSGKLERVVYLPVILCGDLTLGQALERTLGGSFVSRTEGIDLSTAKAQGFERTLTRVRSAALIG